METQILNEIKNKFSINDNTLDTRQIKKSFKKIKKESLCNGDTFLIILDNLNITDWKHVEIWKFYKTIDNKFIILEFSNRKLFDMNKLLNMVYPNLQQESKPIDNSANKHDYKLYSYYKFDNDSTIEDELYRNSTTVYGYKLPSEFNIEN